MASISTSPTKTPAFSAGAPSATDITTSAVSCGSSCCFTSDADSATVTFLLRDFDSDGLLRHEELVRELARQVSPEVTFERWEQYRNMRERLDEVPHVVEAALEATRRVGLEPSVAPIRGGTDGSRLTEMGLHTPNVFTGGNEFHSVREWVTVQDLAISAATVVELVRLWSEPDWADRGSKRVPATEPN